MKWTTAELELLRSMYPECHTEDVAAWIGRSLSSVYNTAFASGLRKSDEYLASDAACRARADRQHPNMIASRFSSGMTPWNKGLKGVNGTSSTRFQRGLMPHTWRPVGSIRIERDGPKVKVSDTRNKAVDWRYVHHIVWEREHGPIPAGKLLVFKPGMKTNDPAQITVDRLELADRATLAKRTHPRNRSPELARLVQLKGAITRQVNRIAREAQEKRA